MVLARAHPRRGPCLGTPTHPSEMSQAKPRSVFLCVFRATMSDNWKFQPV